jgi:SnoaL-like domain
MPNSGECNHPRLILCQIYALLLLAKFQTSDANRMTMGEGDVQRFLDEAACTKILMRYGWAVDRLDRLTLASLFWPDAEVNLGFFRGSGAEVLEFLIINGGSSLRRCHITTNVVIDMDGDTARSDSCAITHAISKDAEGQLVEHHFFGRYLDVLERRQKEWRIRARHYVLHSYTAQPYHEDPALAAMLEAEMSGD